MNEFGSVHYNAIGPWFKKRFGQRVIKLSLDGGFTCPNRDGKLGFGGCSFCSESGSGDFAGATAGSEAYRGSAYGADPQPDAACSAAAQRSWEPVRSQMEAQIGLLSRKWPEASYIAYFQNYTGTYGPAEKLRSLWEEAISFHSVKGLAIATRPDCLGPEVLKLLDEFNKRTFLWVELGLQTSKAETAKAFNRGYENAVYEEAVRHLGLLGIRYVTHLIIGLPGESREDMLGSFRYVVSGAASEMSMTASSSPCPDSGTALPFGIKLHMLHLMEGTRMGEEYKSAPWALPSMEEYAALIADMLEFCPQEITIHRLTGDAPRSLLIAPDWTRNKHAVLNLLQSEFKRRGSFQGSRL
jgi:radical SAM superfamily enzyme